MAESATNGKIIQRFLPYIRFGATLQTHTFAESEHGMDTMSPHLSGPYYGNVLGWAGVVSEQQGEVIAELLDSQAILVPSPIRASNDTFLSYPKSCPY